MKKTIFLSMGLLLSACGASNSSSSGKVVEPTDNNTIPTSSLIQPQQIDQSYVSQFVDLAVHPDGDWCHIARHADLGDNYLAESQWQYGWKNDLTCYNGQQVIWSYQPDNDIALIDIEFSDSNQLIVIEAVRNSQASHTVFNGELRLSTYSPSGDLLRQDWLKHTPSADDLAFYEVDGGNIIRREFTVLSVNDRPQIAEDSVVQLIAEGDHLHLLVHSYGLQVYQLNNDLSINWSRQVMPAYNWLWGDILVNNSEMAIQADGTIAVAFELYGEDSAIYNEHFSTDFPVDNQDANVGLVTLDQTGELLSQHLMGNTELSEQIVRVFWQEDTVTLIGNVRREKTNAAGGTTEWDSFIYRVDPVSGQTIDEDVLDYDKEDIIIDATVSPNGKIWLAGKSGYIQVDSNSQTSFGRAVLLQIDDQKRLTERANLDLPRHSEIKQVFWLQDHLYFRYDFDAPITHTCDHDDTLCWRKSGVGSIPGGN